ncbi:MAG: hypothetical protein SNJ72_09525 [Fimbriimonadales bacterium]
MSISQKQLLSALRERATLSYANPPRLVLAFYYPWYGNPTHSGRWLHWEAVDTERKQIAASTHYPSLGAYDSNDPAAIDQHCRWAKQAGLDGFIVSWWGVDSVEEKPIPALMNAAERHGLRVAFYYEQVPKPGDPESALNDLLYLVERYTRHPASLTIGGRLVVFVYARAVEQLSLTQWAWVLAQVNRRTRSGICAIADRLSRTAGRIFDGIHTYNPVGRLYAKPVGKVREELNNLYQSAFQQVDPLLRITCATVIPGYDDTKIRKPGLKVERFGGELYRQQWEAVLELMPDWVLITSFNEWHEGSEIEPSVEHGESYLTLTAEYAKRFRQLGERPRIATPLTALGNRQLQSLRRTWRNRPIALFPNPDSEALHWLIQVGLTIEPLEMEELIDPQKLQPQRLPLLVYAGGESYPTRVRSEGDVDRALLAYLRAGGCLLALPSEPLPLYYDENRRIVDGARRLGLPIASSSSNPIAGVSGFERPPVPNLQFEFHRQHLPDMGTQPVPFPTGGDLRWRPLLREGLGTGDEYIPLATLKEPNGRSWGEGAGVIRYRAGGTVGYVWFRLLDIPQAPILLHNLFHWLGRTL